MIDKDNKIVSGLQNPFWYICNLHTAPIIAGSQIRQLFLQKVYVSFNVSKYFYKYSLELKIRNIGILEKFAGTDSGTLSISKFDCV